jgi:hypothetical protein
MGEEHGLYNEAQGAQSRLWPMRPGCQRRSRGVRAGLGRITPCLRRVRLVRASPPRRPGGPRLRLRQVSQKSPVHPLLGLTPPAPKRSVPLEFCQFGNSVPRQDRNGAPFALLARCRPQSPLMAPHLNSRSGCPGHSTLRVEGLEVHVKVGTNAAHPTSCQSGSRRLRRDVPLRTT